MKVEPLPKGLFDRAKALGVTSIELSFSGGSDEGYLHVSFSTEDAVSYERNELNPDGKFSCFSADKREGIAKHWDEQGDADKAKHLRDLDLLDALESDIDDWAWDVYEYGGAGDGSDYGDDIEYDLVNMQVTTSGWHMVHSDCASEFEGGGLEVAEESEVANDSV